MYIWNIKELAQALKERRIAEQSKRTYFIVGIALLAIGVLTYPFLLVTERANTLDIIDMMIYRMLNLIGLCAAYMINQSGDRQDFWLRCFSLFIPLTLRVILIVFVLKLVGYAIPPSIFPPLLSDETNWFDLFVSIGTDLYFIGMMVKYFKVINR
ncbi:hypothetical protein [Domibacillus aminovorans]|uniref:Uncharacterized protein n=1 Tax=Domibacillus aminovorans TaxID=29332 RepID=A0A177LCM5_9BACI|nr:hypothetical protein [Domibacillus aminovorans]OAH63136.1 hypothetical protein AWH49_07305 [Domibacillus aminovorans]